MAVGQGVLRAVLDVGALDAVEARLEQHEVARSAAHAGLLRDVLELQRLHTAGGAVATVAQLALSTRCSKFRALNDVDADPTMSPRRLSATPVIFKDGPLRHSPCRTAPLPGLQRRVSGPAPA